MKKQALVKNKNKRDSFKERAESIKQKYSIEELPAITEHNSVSEFPSEANKSPPISESGKLQASIISNKSTESTKAVFTNR